MVSCLRADTSLEVFIDKSLTFLTTSKFASIPLQKPIPRKILRPHHHQEKICCTCNSYILTRLPLSRASLPFLMVLIISKQSIPSITAQPINFIIPLPALIPLALLPIYQVYFFSSLPITIIQAILPFPFPI